MIFVRIVVVQWNIIPLRIDYFDGFWIIDDD